MARFVSWQDDYSVVSHGPESEYVKVKVVFHQIIRRKLKGMAVVHSVVN